MTPLHALETHKKLNAYTNSAIRESVRHIVGVQFRNCATVGGSIFGRFGFSDVLTMFLALDTWVELYNGGTIPLAQFASCLLYTSAVGTCIPLFFKKVGVDPAVASGPLITTMNDLVAVITYYGMSWIFLIEMFHLAG